MIGEEAIGFRFLLQGHFEVHDAFGSFAHLVNVLYMQIEEDIMIST